jgi:hypothetical protein
VTASHRVALSDTTYAQLAALAQDWNTTPGDAVRRLVHTFATPTATPTSAPDGIGVYAIYAGYKISGVFDPVTRSITVSDGPAPGLYKSPGGASTAVRRALNPTAHPIRNGWHFWRLASTNQLLDTLRTTPATPRT